MPSAANRDAQPNRPLVLNGFDIELPTEVDVIVRPMREPSDVKPERERLAGHWFIHGIAANCTVYG